jgi:hypothetical protein
MSYAADGKVTNAAVNYSLLLGQDELSRYADEGLVVPRYKLPIDIVNRLRDLVDGLIAANPKVPPELLLDVNVDDRKLHDNMVGNKEFLRYAAYPPLLLILEQILGPDILLWDCAVICKPPGDGKEIPWHQDSRYFVKISPLATATIWIAVDGSTPENGGMKYIPGSHKRGVLNHVRLDKVIRGFEEGIDPTEYDESLAKDVVLEPGQFCVFQAHTIHGSPANRSTRRRAGLIYRYIPGTVVYDDSVPSLLDGNGKPIDPRGRPVYLLRGQDRTGRNKLTPFPLFLEA